MLPSTNGKSIALRYRRYCSTAILCGTLMVPRSGPRYPRYMFPTGCWVIRADISARRNGGSIPRGCQPAIPTTGSGRPALASPHVGRASAKRSLSLLPARRPTWHRKDPVDESIDSMKRQRQGSYCAMVLAVLQDTPSSSSTTPPPRRNPSTVEQSRSIIDTTVTVHHRY
jgi:hypothetical protein